MKIKNNHFDIQELSTTKLYVFKSTIVWNYAEEEIVYFGK